MNLRKYILATAAGTLMAGCSNSFLDLADPNQVTDASFWQSAQDYTDAMHACYGTMLFQGIFEQWYDLAFEMRADLCYNESAWRDYANFSKFRMPDSNWDTNRFCWRDYFAGVNACNIFLAHIDNAPSTLDAELRQRYKGEVSFLRALYYFNMYHLWGPRTPVITEPHDGMFYPKEGSEELIWEQIEKDLATACDANLPDEIADAELGRVSSGAVWALMGKAYLQQHKWKQAADAFSHIIGRYRLTDNYFDNFDLDHEFNSESIFEVVFTTDTKGNWTAYGTSQSPSYTQRARYFAPRSVGGHSDAMPNMAYVDEFDAAEFGCMTVAGKEDPRKKESIIYTRSQKLYGKTFAQLSGSTVDRVHPNIWSRKYSNGVREGVTQETDYSGINMRLIRYADVLLMMAEALNEQGLTAEAYQYIDQVRMRPSVNLVPLSQFHPGMTQEQMRQQIEHERICELGSESVRWFDIMRWGYLDNEAGKARLLERDYEFETYRPAYDKFLPIPQRNIDLNPNFSANFGY